MLAEGYRVVLAGRREEKLLETGAGHALALTVPCDITRPDDVERLFAVTLERWGRVDVLLNNAGTFGPSAAVDELSPEDWDGDGGGEHHRVPALCRCRGPGDEGADAAGRPDHQQRLHLRPLARPRSVAYTVTKHAITGLTKSIELDGRGLGITCGQIDIGNAATGLMDTIGVGDGALQADGSRRWNRPSRWRMRPGRC